MNEKELKENIEKIKQLLTIPDYDKIDAGIELAVSLEEPKIFEELLKGCVSIIDLNDWMKSTITQSGSLNGEPTGYYIKLSLLINNPLTDFTKIREINITNGYLRKLPKNFSKFQQLEKLNLQLNKLDKIPNEVLKINSLSHLHLGWNRIKDIPDEISELENLESLMLGNNSIKNIPNSFCKLTSLKHLDIGSNYFCEGEEWNEYLATLLKLKNLINLNYINYDLDEDYNDKIAKELQNCYIIKPVNCGQCGEKFRVEDTIERWDEYFCESCDEGWNNPALFCDCCDIYVASRGYTGAADEPSNPGNNKDLKDGYDSVRWFIDSSSYITGNAPAFEDVEDYYEYVDKMIIKNQESNFEAKFICELCTLNIPVSDKASYEEAEKYAEENNIEYWDN